MKKLRKNLLVAVLVVSITFVAIGLTGKITTLAATTVNLGTADNFVVLGGSTVTNTGSSVVTGDLGVSPGAAITGFPPGTVVSGAIYAADATALQAQNDLATAYGNAASQACTQDLTGQDLGGLTLTPGVYCFDTSAQLTGTLTLNGQNDPSAVFIFKIGSTLTTASNSNISLINSAQVCRVFWQVGSSATLGTSTNFKGNILALTSITLNTSANVEGRLLAQNGAVTLDTNNITKAICTTSLHLRKTITNDNGGTALNTAWTLTATGVGGSPTNLSGNTPVNSSAVFNADTYALAESGGPSGYTAGTYSCVKNGGVPVISNSITLATGDDATCTINNNDIAPQLTVTKVVINDNAGTKVISNFPLFIDGVSVTSGLASTTSATLHTVSETSDSGYSSTIAGDCAANGTITLLPGDVKICTITNDDIPAVVGGGGGGGFYSSPVPPLIDVVKIPSPLALPNGSGNVTYNYTLKNIGTIPVTNLTMVDDSCSSVILTSGDINNDAKLDVSETWAYKCSVILLETHTNTVTATGWANGISATDIARATVVVGLPVVPPLIHITKVPNPLTLPAGGGMVTYTKKITNPGTIALSNVKITDDKCSPIKYISGDTNKDSRLDPTETWTYTCQSNLTKTTVNTAIASGEANGLSISDFAIATVIVASAVNTPPSTQVTTTPATIVPKLPNTGATPKDYNIILNTIILLGSLLLISTPLVIVLKKSKF